MAGLHVTLLGHFRVATAEGAEIPIETRKTRAVLAYLVMARGRPVPRDRLAGLLWSRGEMRQALASLSQALYSLRRALEPHAPGLISADVETVSSDLSCLTVDALELEDTAGDATAQTWARNLAIYTGPFLSDLGIDAEESYSEWRAAEQARLENLVNRAGTALMGAWEAAPETADAEAVDHLLGIDPYSEPAMRVRLRLLAQDGRPAAALEAAERFAARLSDDLGIAPSNDLAALVAAIREGKIQAASPGAPPTGMKRRRLRMRRGRPYGLAAAIFFAVAGVALWVLPDRPPDREGMRLLVRPFAAGGGIEAGLAAGFGDDLATELVRRAGLEIMSRESGRLIPEDAAEKSGASHVLQGRLRSDGDLMVLNLWITEVARGREVWAGRFTGPAADPRRFRDQVVTSIADQIDLTLAPAPHPPAAPLPPDAMPDYLRGLSLLHAGTADANAEAIAALTPLAGRYPDAVGPAAALAVAHERIAFEADDYARAVGRHWLEGYLALKAILAESAAAHPDLVAARARLALRRLDFAAAEALAREALRLEPAHVGSLEVLAEAQSLSGLHSEAEAAANRVIALSPGAPEQGYIALALARLVAGDIDGARAAAASAREFAETPSVRLLALIAALEGLAGNDAAARQAYGDFVSVVESRPFGASRLGAVAYDNPRAATWRRPRPAEAAALFGFADAGTRERVLEGLTRADPDTESGAAGSGGSRSLSGAEIRETLFGREIAGTPSWLVQQPWRQVRTGDGALFQTGTFGPLPAASEGTSQVFDDRLCDQWFWNGLTLETCQLVLRSGGEGRFVLVGEIGHFEFDLID